jgi:surfactin synthase thioesterase subunit/glycosyltransferase involved in cell wall biosynthesis
MRILLAHNSTYFPSLGGGDKSNRLLMEALAARGHEVRVFTRTERLDEASHDRYLEELARRGQHGEVQPNGEVRMLLGGVDVRTLTRSPHLRAAFQAHIDQFQPHIILTSTDDPGQLLFDLAVRAPQARVVYLVRATIAVPFGPDSAGVNVKKTAALRQADGVVGVSHYVAGYVRQWAGIEAIHVPISLLENVPEYQDLGRFDNRFISMVNPCAVKGIDIFLELARQRPRLEFCAIPTWGTQPDELAAMKAQPNVTLMDPVDDIDELLRVTRVMLVPSVWAEARSRVVLEAMSRGVPVVASDAGGLHEAKLGVPYLVPINPIRHYRPSLDASMVPIADVPPQDIRPWLEVIDKLTLDRAHWDEIKAHSRKAALDYATNLNVILFEEFLEELRQRPKKDAAGKKAELSDAKKRLLALKLRQKAAAKSAAGPTLWFPGCAETAGAALRLFCFPWAGGGSLAFASWKEPCAGVAQVCAARLPGRETRAGEAPLTDMRELAAALAREIRPLLDRPFAFFGHSMGAGIAFELARALRREGQPLPLRLFVSSARSPVLRREPPPGPPLSREELLTEIERLEGFPREVLDNPKLLELALPALEADARLYREYVSPPEAPLNIPIHVFSGTLEPNLREDDLARWGELTTAECTVERLPGGHFYLEAQRGALIELIRRRLMPA